MMAAKLIPGSGPDARQIRYAKRAVTPAGEVEIEMHSKAADGTVLNNIFLTGTIQDGLMTAKGAFQMGRKVTLDWHKN